MKGQFKTFSIGSQNEMILDYLKTGKSLTVETARKKGFGPNLRSRVSDLKECGYKVVSKNIKFDGGYYDLYTLDVSWVIGKIEELADIKIDDIFCLYKDDERLIFVNDDENLKDDVKLLFRVYELISKHGFNAVPF